MSLMITINIFMSIMFLFIKHPLSMGITLLMQTTWSAIMISFMSSSSWYSYILFIVMVGGMMVLFIYMTSIASNEKFSFNPMLILLIIPSFILMLINNKFFFSISSMNIDYAPLMNKFNKFCSNPLFCLSILMFMYLLITMIATVKITSFSNSPLRQMN